MCNVQCAADARQHVVTRRSQQCHARVPNQVRDEKESVLAGTCVSEDHPAGCYVAGHCRLRQQAARAPLMLAATTCHACMVLGPVREWVVIKRDQPLNDEQISVLQ